MVSEIRLERSRLSRLCVKEYRSRSVVVLTPSYGYVLRSTPTTLSVAWRLQWRSRNSEINCLMVKTTWIVGLRCRWTKILTNFMTLDEDVRSMNTAADEHAKRSNGPYRIGQAGASTRMGLSRAVYVLCGDDRNLQYHGSVALPSAGVTEPYIAQYVCDTLQPGSRYIVPEPLFYQHLNLHHTQYTL